MAVKWHHQNYLASQTSLQNPSEVNRHSFIQQVVTATRPAPCWALGMPHTAQPTRFLPALLRLTLPAEAGDSYKRLPHPGAFICRSEVAHPGLGFQPSNIGTDCLFRGEAQLGRPTQAAITKTGAQEWDLGKTRCSLVSESIDTHQLETMQGMQPFNIQQGGSEGTVVAIQEWWQRVSSGLL